MQTIYVYSKLIFSLDWKAKSAEALQKLRMTEKAFVSEDGTKSEGVPLLATKVHDSPGTFSQSPVITSLKKASV